VGSVGREGHSVEGHFLVERKAILVSIFDIEAIDHVIYAQRAEVGGLGLFGGVYDAPIVDVDLNGAKKLVHIKL
jgi:hypothetical protein